MGNGGVRIGWIGSGRMGAAMATRLLDRGNDVTVTNRTRARAEALGAHGATVADTPRELADREIVFVMVSADQDVLAVTVGENGVLTNPDVAPTYLVDSSTISAETSATVRAACERRGTKFLAAPVSGNPNAVAAGQLTFAVSGDRDAFDRVSEYLHQIGAGVTFVGDGDVARLVKLCHNMFLGVIAQSLSEIMVLAESHGIKRSALLEFINNSVLGSPFTRYKSPAFVDLDFTPTFTTALLRKDFNLGMAAATATGTPVPIASLTAELVASAIGAGYGAQDFAALLVEQARRGGLVLSPEDPPNGDGLVERPVPTAASRD